MLFSGKFKGCFSPSVPRTFRKAWVKHGGTIINSTEDFYRADFFFCEGMTDPWLSTLLSRSRIVYHPSWILKSIAEQFLMPRAKYVLDDHFDASKIDLRVDISDNYPLPPPPAPQPRASPSPLHKMKRPLDLSNETNPDLQQPPTKKPRIDDSNNVTNVSKIKHSLFPQRDLSSFSSIVTKSRTHHKPEETRILPLNDHNSKSRIKLHSQRTSDQRVYFKETASSPPLAALHTDVNIRTNTKLKANPMTEYWTQILRTRPASSSSSHPLTISIPSLLHHLSDVPPLDSTFFKVGKVYQDKVFRNLDHVRG